MKDKAFKFDFVNGVKIKSSQIETWHKEVYNELKSGSSYSYKGSGNSFVYGTVDAEGIIEIREVTNGYKSYQYV